MDMSTQSRNEHARKADTYCIMALLSLSVAILVLSVGVFLLYPTSIIGLFSTGLGIIATLISILYFSRYHHHIRLAEQKAPSSNR